MNSSRTGFALLKERLYVSKIFQRTLPGSGSIDHMSISDLTWRDTTFSQGTARNPPRWNWRDSNPTARGRVFRPARPSLKSRGDARG